MTLLAHACKVRDTCYTALPLDLASSQDTIQRLLVALFHPATGTNMYYVVHGPVHFTGQDSTIIQNTHKTRSIVTEIVYVYIQHNT